MSGDPRSRRIAVVADALLLAYLPTLRAGGFGVMQLPAAGIADAVAEDWIEQTAEQVAEYRRNGYEVVVIDDGTSGEGLADALERLGVPPLPPFDRVGRPEPDEADEGC